MNRTSQRPTNRGEDFSEYVAHLQMHMALQSRNLVPSIKSVTNSREQLLRDTQADFEKIASRQTHSLDA